jgi:hypothetical protein
MPVGPASATPGRLYADVSKITSAMTVVAALTLATVNLLLIALAFYVRSGGTWVLSGYDRARVTDERGLAIWCGNGLAGIGAVGLVAAGIIAVAPGSTLFATIAYLVAVGCGIFVINRGARRFLCW